MPQLKIPEPDSQEVEYQFIPTLSGGLNLETREEDINATELIVARNVRFEKNRVLVDTGYKAFGSTVRGDGRATFQFFTTTGTSALCLITDDTFYIWRSSQSQWVYVSDGTSTTLDGGEPTSETAIAVVDETGFSANDYIGIELDDGTQHQTTVASTSAGVINIDDALPSAAANGNVLLKAKDLSGSDDISISIDVYAPNNWLIFTNGVDTPQRYDGTTVEDVPNLPGSTFAARVVSVYKSYVIFLHTTEDGTSRPQRVRWSDTGDPGTWTGGNSGFADLVETEDFIVSAVKLGPYLVIYKERAIIRAEFVGTATEIFVFPVTVTGEGASSLDSVVDLGDEHLFFGNSNIYIYAGGYTIEAIGDMIYYRTFGSQGELNPTYTDRVQCIYIEELDEVWIFYPAASEQFPGTTLRYLVSEKSFATRKWPLALTGYGFFVLEATIEWNDLVGDWSAQEFEWGAKTILANAPTTHLCFGTQIYEYDYLEEDDDGTAITYTIETGDFYSASYFLTFDYLEFSMKGNCTVAYSVDEGDSYITLGNIVAGNAFSRQRLYKQFQFRKIRFRISGSSTGFALEWLGFTYTLDSEW